PASRRPETLGTERGAKKSSRLDSSLSTPAGGPQDRFGYLLAQKAAGAPQFFLARSHFRRQAGLRLVDYCFGLLARPVEGRFTVPEHGAPGRLPLAVDFLPRRLKSSFVLTRFLLRLLRLLAGPRHRA